MVSQISPTQTFALRSEQLRNNAPHELCVFDADYLKDTFHLGYFIPGTLTPTVILTMQKENMEEWQGEGYRLRGMATSSAGQGKGYGQLTLASAMGLCYSHRLADYVWCHAREIAYGFYLKMGFQFVGESFTVPHIGTHTIMVNAQIAQYSLTEDEQKSINFSLPFNQQR